MQAKKIIIINSIIFLIFLAIAFAVGFFVMRELGAIPVTAAAESDEAPPKIFNVEIKELSATSTTIIWETNEDSDSLINYGMDKNYGVIRDPRADKISHVIVIDDLLAGTDYFFRITSSDEEGNQGITNDYSFKTLLEKKDGETDETGTTEDDGMGEGEEIIRTGDSGLNVDGVESILEAIEKVNTEESLEKIIEKVQEKAEEIITPPTIILDYADVEVGTDWAIITWATDKESNSIVALAEAEDFDETFEDPYVWREGKPDELVLGHVVEVNGLSPATEYHFQVSSESSLNLTGRSTDKVFKTKSITPEIFNLQITKIQEESVTIRWTTNVPCSSIVEYTNLNNADTKLEGSSAFITVHSMKLTNLVFDTYYSVKVKVESKDGEKTESEVLTFITTRDEAPPEISKVTTESTIYPGSENRIQTIVSWRTDEISQCQLFYHQGLVLLDEADSLALEEEYAVKHVEVATSFFPGEVYKFWIICVDEAENSVRSEDFTMLTPSQEESIIDIIIKNFESSFGWIKGK